MAGPSEMVPLDDVSVVAPEHAEVRPELELSELNGRVAGGLPPMLATMLATNPVLSTESSAVKVTSIVPVEDVTAAGVDVPEKLPSSGADVVMPP